MVVRNGCRVVAYCQLDYSKGFLGGRGTLKVSRVGLFLPKYYVAATCSLVFCLLEKNVPTPFPLEPLLFYTILLVDG